MKSKNCTRCKQKKELDKFSPHKEGKDGKQTRCKKCNNEINREYHKKYPWKSVFRDIKQRCNNPNHIYYKNYGGRGIKCQITVEEVKKLWFRDKAWLLEKPSIDRKDNDRNYTYKNCRFMENGMNSAKDSSKQVNQYDLNGNFIKTWKSGMEIQRVLGFASSNISNTCTEKYKTSHGFKWSYTNKNKRYER